jgi:hypothetical protein
MSHSDFGFWILDFGLKRRTHRMSHSDFGFWILDFGLKRRTHRMSHSNFEFWILDWIEANPPAAAGGTDFLSAFICVICG